MAKKAVKKAAPKKAAPRKKAEKPITREQIQEMINASFDGIIKQVEPKGKEIRKDLEIFIVDTINGKLKNVSSNGDPNEHNDTHIESLQENGKLNYIIKQAK